jgi:outer membrane immunogenic protein
VLRRAAVLTCVTGLFAFIASPSVSAQGGRFSWTGFYVGAHGAYAWADQEFPHADPPPNGPPRMDLSGGMLGGQIGAQYHFKGGVLVGIEGDISKGKLTETVRDGNAITQTGEIELMGTLRARVGLPMGSWMPYVTGGVIWQRASYNQICPDPAAVPFGHCNPTNGFAPYNLTDTQTHVGWVFGGGLEVMVGPHFSVKAEGLFYKVGEETYNLGTTPSGKVIPPTTIEYDGALFRLGGNYRF